MKESRVIRSGRAVVFSVVVAGMALITALLIYADDDGTATDIDKPATASETISIRSYIDTAFGAERAHDLSKTKAYHRKALELARSRSQWDSVSLSYSFLANGIFRVDRDEILALAILDSAENVARDLLKDPRMSLAYSLWVRGEIHNFFKRRDSAQECYTKSIAFAEAVEPVSRVLFNCYYSLAVLYSQQGDFAAYFNALEECLVLAINIVGEKSAHVAATYQQLAEGYETIQNYSRAYRYYDRALAIKRELLGENNQSLAISYTGMASVLHARADYGEAIGMLERAISIIRSSIGERHLLLAGCYRQLGEAYRKQGNLLKAVECCEQAREMYSYIRNNKLGESPDGVLEVLVTLARSQIDLGLYEQARQSLTEGQALVQEFGLTAALQVEVLCAWGELYRVWNKADESLRYYQQALMACVPNFRDSSFTANPDIKARIWDAYLLDALLGKFETLALQRSDGADQGTDASDLALATFRLALQLINRIEREYVDETWKYIWMKRFRSQFDRALRIAEQMYQVGGDLRYLKFALYVSEHSKAVVYRAHFNESKAKLNDPVLDSLLNIESDLKLELAGLRHELQSDKSRADDQSDSIRANTSELIFAKWKELEDFTQVMEEYYPSYRFINDEDWLNDGRSLQQSLPSDSCTILDYYQGADFIQIVALSAASSSLLHIPIDSSFGRQIAQLRAAIVGKNYQAFIGPANSLYELLLAPSELNIDHENITIIPDAEIGLIPFDCLISEAANPAVPDYRKLRYLMRDYCIQYDFSVSLLADSARRRQYRAESGTYAGFAPEFYGAQY